MKKLAAIAGTIILAVAVIMATQIRTTHGMQISLPATTGMVAPLARGAGLPAVFLTCNASSAYLPFWNTLTDQMSACDGSTWHDLGLPTPRLSGITGSIGGSALAVGSCATGTATVTGATPGMVFGVTRTDGSFIGGGFIKDATVITAGVVTVNICATVLGTPPAKTYSVLQ